MKTNQQIANDFAYTCNRLWNGMTHEQRRMVIEEYEIGYCSFNSAVFTVALRIKEGR